MDLIQKVRNKERLTQEEGEALYDLDLYTLGELADEIRQKKYGKKSYFNINRHINPTNVCADICKFCAYSASRKNPNQYTMSHDEILTIAENSIKNGAKELHIVSAHNPNDGVEWYMGAFRKIRERFPDVHIKSMTAAEIDFLYRQYGLSYDEVLDLMIENGVVYQKENNFLKVKEFPSGQEVLKTYAISRIMLDNIPHIKAYWATSTINLALIAQEFGADDLDGTIEKESIQSAAGAASSRGMNLDDFVAMIKNSGFQAIERDSLYNELKEY